MFPIYTGVMGIQIKYATAEMTPRTAEHILIQIDVQVLFPGIIIAARATDIVDRSSVGRTRNADKWDNIGYMNLDHAASFPGDALRIPLIDAFITQLPAP